MKEDIEGNGESTLLAALIAPSVNTGLCTSALITTSVDTLRGRHFTLRTYNTIVTQITL